MAQEKNTGERYNDALDIGTVKIADDVVALIAAFAAMEVEGVSGMAGDLDMNTVSKGGMKRLGKTVKVGSKVQDRVKTSIENMTGLEVKDVNIRVSGIKMND